MVLSQVQLDRIRETSFDRNSELPAEYQCALFDEAVRVQNDVLQARNLTRRKVLLIGGAGYVGTVITDHLLKMGYQVRCLDQFLYGNQQCATPFLADPGYEFEFGDLCDVPTIQRALDGVTDLVFLAGLVGDPITKKYPEASQQINVDGILRTLDAIQGKGLNKVVFISTCSNYGLIPADHLAAEDFELKPLSLYASAKVRIEQEILSGKGRVDFHPTVLRFATAFGLSPRMRFDLTVNEFVREMYLKRDLLVFDADTWRPYCHVQDFARAVRRVLEAPISRVDFEVFNTGGEVNNFTKQGIVDTIKAHLPDAPVSYKQHGTDPRNYRVNFGKIKDRLYFEPKYTVQDGIVELIEALKNHVFDRVDEQKNFFGNYEIQYDAR